MNRRDFFSSVLSKTAGGQNSAKPLLPYVKDIFALKTMCPVCKGLCANACDKDIIVLSEGIPKIDFQNGYCTFCKKCANACDKGVLDEKQPSYIDAVFSIKTKSCLSWNNTMCYTCKDVCQYKAISFFGVFRPTINNDLCVGCGECASVCEAILIKPNKEFA